MTAQPETPTRPVVGPVPRHRRPAAVDYVWALARISLGWVFLWAFLDKTFGLGHETASGAAWIDGGSPTDGFLTFAPVGPFQGFYNDLAGNTLVDWLFMLGLLGVGVAFLAGIGIRLAAACGALLLVMMWSAVLPPENNPFMDDHIIYALLGVGLAMTRAGDTLGLGTWWRGTDLVRRNPWLA